jgi:uncharacterized protein (DUF2236 family)
LKSKWYDFDRRRWIMVAERRKAVGREIVGDEVEGLFGSRSLFWKVWQETAGLFGSGRAVLLQLAHPMVAQGVADHRRVQGDPVGRLNRTLEMMLTIVFGSRPEAEAMLRQFHALHGPIKGQLALEAGPYATGTGYTAMDPALKMWVHATLMDTGLLVYERFVAPLSLTEQALFYDDSRLLATRMGIPPRLIPATLTEFQDYMDDMLRGDQLVVTDMTRELARAVFNPDVNIVLKAAARTEAFVTAGLLPEHLRVAYGMPWDRRRQRILDTLSYTTRHALPLLPGPLRFMPQARAARRRLRTFQG